MAMTDQTVDMIHKAAKEADLQVKDILTHDAYDEYIAAMAQRGPMHGHGVLLPPAGGFIPPSFAPATITQRQANTAVKAVLEKRERVKHMPPHEHLRKVLATRLRLAEGQLMPFHALEFCVRQDKVYVFVVNDTGATIIEDDPALFPSDTLIAALQLLEG